MKLVLSIWITELLALAIAINVMVSCNPEHFTPRKRVPAPLSIPAPKPQSVPQYPNILETMPSIYVSAMDELEQMVKDEVNEKEKEYAMRR